MKLSTLVNNYRWAIDLFDVYDYKTNNFLYGTGDAKTIGLNTWVKAFSVYNTTVMGDNITILEIWI